MGKKEKPPPKIEARWRAAGSGCLEDLDRLWELSLVGMPGTTPPLTLKECSSYYRKKKKQNLAASGKGSGEMRSDPHVHKEVQLFTVKRDKKVKIKRMGGGGKSQTSCELVWHQSGHSQSSSKGFPKSAREDRRQSKPSGKMKKTATEKKEETPYQCQITQMESYPSSPYRKKGRGKRTERRIFNDRGGHQRE